MLWYCMWSTSKIDDVCCYSLRCGQHVMKASSVDLRLTQKTNPWVRIRTCVLLGLVNWHVLLHECVPADVFLSNCALSQSYLFRRPTPCQLASMCMCFVLVRQAARSASVRTRWSHTARSARGRPSASWSGCGTRSGASCYWMVNQNATGLLFCMGAWWLYKK